MKKEVPIIDLFAGPGGLGEGFTSIVDENNNRVFKIALSIEKDEFAHRTLTLRSFLRQFPYNALPKEYYQFLRSEEQNLESLYIAYPLQAAAAKKEAWQFELGNQDTHALIDKRIKESLKGEKDFVLIVGPPCQAYSLVGRARRREGKGLDKDDERVYLYREYYRILAQHRPAIFVMENVKGLLSSTVENENVFKQIKSDLEDPIRAYKKLKGQQFFYKSRIGYNIYSLVSQPKKIPDLFGFRPYNDPKDFVIRSEDFGIPQCRHRVILLGIRTDIDIIPTNLQPHSSKVPVEDVLSGLPKLRSGLSRAIDDKYEWKNLIRSIRLKDWTNEIDSDVLNYMLRVAESLTLPKHDRGDSFIHFTAKVNYKPGWYLDEKINGVCNHETRGHIPEDIFRYFFVSCFGKVKGRSPKLYEFPRGLLPKHKNVQPGADMKKFADRFRVQQQGEPAKTITSHISKDGHYFIHPDTTQCRSLTVREAARIQTFPDNYFFCGPRTEQFHQVGNAVPPLLANKIASIVHTVFKRMHRENEDLLSNASANNIEKLAC